MTNSTTSTATTTTTSHYPSPSSASLFLPGTSSSLVVGSAADSGSVSGGGGSQAFVGSVNIDESALGVVDRDFTVEFDHAMTSEGSGFSTVSVRYQTRLTNTIIGNEACG